MEEQNESECHYQSGIEYIRNYRPIEHDNYGNVDQNIENDTNSYVKSIRYK